MNVQTNYLLILDAFVFSKFIKILAQVPFVSMKILIGIQKEQMMSNTSKIKIHNPALKCDQSQPSDIVGKLHNYNIKH
jgi:hypothetical protein